MTSTSLERFKHRARLGTQVAEFPRNHVTVGTCMMYDRATQSYISSHRTRKLVPVRWYRWIPWCSIHRLRNSCSTACCQRERGVHCSQAHNVLPCSAAGCRQLLSVIATYQEWWQIARNLLFIGTSKSNTGIHDSFRGLELTRGTFQGQNHQSHSLKDQKFLNKYFC